MAETPCVPDSEKPDGERVREGRGFSPVRHDRYAQHVYHYGGFQCIAGRYVAMMTLQKKVRSLFAFGVAIMYIIN